jgi:hypothetical protein
MRLAPGSSRERKVAISRLVVCGSFLNGLALVKRTLMRIVSPTSRRMQARLLAFVGRVVAFCRRKARYGTVR